MKPTLDSFTRAYITCALWSSTDEDGEPLDKRFTAEDFAPDALDALKAHAASFFYRAYPWINTEPEPKLSGEGTDRWSHAGHDFWLTSAGHGSGFWDGDWPVYGEVLTAKAKNYEGVEIYVGDDGKLHV